MSIGECIRRLSIYTEVLSAEEMINRIEFLPLGSDPQDIAINPVTDIAIVTLEKANSVSIVDLNTEKVISTIPVGKKPKGVAIDNELNLALVSNSKDNTVSVIDLNALSVIKTITVGKSPEGIAVDSINHTALVANHKDDTVSVIDLLNYKVIFTIPVGKEPKDIAIDPALNLALVVNEKDYNVSVIDLNTYQVTGTVSVGQKPQAIDINPDPESSSGHIVAIANGKDNSITVINLNPPIPPLPKEGEGGFETTTIPVCKHPADISINSLDNRALVICDEDRILQLIPPLEKGEGGGFYYPSFLSTTTILK